MLENSQVKLRFVLVTFNIIMFSLRMDGKQEAITDQKTCFENSLLDGSFYRIYAFMDEHVTNNFPKYLLNN